MLAALLLNLEPIEKRGPILRETASLRDVVRAGEQIERLLFPLPAKAKAKVKRAVEKVYEYQALPTVDMSMLGEAQKKTQEAIASVQSFMTDMQEPQWLIEVRLILQQLIVLQGQLNDDEEALLLLM